MDKTLASIGSFLENNFDFHTMILLKNVDKIRKLVDVLNTLNISYFILHRGKSPVWIFTKLNNTGNFSNYKNFVVLQYEYGTSFVFNFKTSSFVINNELFKDVNTSADIVSFDTVIYGENYSTKHLHETVTENDDLTKFANTNCFNFNNTKYTYTFQNGVKNEKFFDTKVFYKIFYYSN
tara:strand:+ start:1998 stop:2534 length:537 start_codon:yes stop_codon:yes gene_type:complete